MRKRCVFTYRSRACGYSGDAPDCDKTAAACATRGNLLRFGGELDSRYITLFHQDYLAMNQCRASFDSPQTTTEPAVPVTELRIIVQENTYDQRGREQSSRTTHALAIPMPMTDIWANEQSENYRVGGQIEEFLVGLGITIPARARAALAAIEAKNSEAKLQSRIKELERQLAASDSMRIEAQNHQTKFATYCRQWLRFADAMVAEFKGRKIRLPKEIQELDPRRDCDYR